MRLAIVTLAAALALAAGVSPAAAQVPSAGYYQDGFYYAPGATPDTYWPSNNETAYDYGVYAYAPGYGPYLRLGGESGWNPNIGTTYNSYPPGNYYTDYGMPYLAVPRVWPYAAPTYGVSRYGPVFCWPAYPFCR
jgi:hypothetical protein